MKKIKVSAKINCNNIKCSFYRSGICYRSEVSLVLENSTNILKCESFITEKELKNIFHKVLAVTKVE